MAAKSKNLRPIITLQSSADTGYRYVITKNRHNNPDRMRIRTYDPIVRTHVEFVEIR